MFNILLVDDEEKITEVVKAYLDKEGYNTKVAYDGKQAIDLFNDNEFDLVILDRMLPDISGEEICEKIRETSLVHIIMLTAKTDDEDKIDGFNLGCDDYVCKPFNVKELILRIKAVFRKMEKNEDILKVKDEIEVNT
ncbi:response regulator transcription factor, partial [Terrisporobacter sp.]|uniref:response regulator transcription factor n=1 Tax=Terrisporobacter sp. TaxID=1965305 RepID=UPI002636024A